MPFGILPAAYFLYRDLDEEGREYWNPDKQWDGADVCDKIAWLLGEHGLVPEQCLAEAVTYALYDMAVGRLTSDALHGSYKEAIEKAASRKNVVILPVHVPGRPEQYPAGEAVRVRLQSEEYGCEDFRYGDLEQALTAVRRLYYECRSRGDVVQRQISILVGPSRGN